MTAPLLLPNTDAEPIPLYSSTASASALCTSTRSFVGSVRNGLRIASAVVCQDGVLIGQAVRNLGVVTGIAPTARDQQQAGPATAALKLDVGPIGDDRSCSETRAHVPLL